MILSYENVSHRVREPRIDFVESAWDTTLWKGGGRLQWSKMCTWSIETFWYQYTIPGKGRVTSIGIVKPEDNSFVFVTLTLLTKGLSQWNNEDDKDWRIVLYCIQSNYQHLTLRLYKRYSPLCITMIPVISQGDVTPSTACCSQITPLRSST